ncbi:highly divergent homeobox [Spea bombifrons]|uniref:highly divergent homeobox n=1 Tax=Spea bombifrons TaxID=233779 RepID=UPI002349F2DA|nr:highly divergent homeobox [Spea bombifrons]XP_053329807.1 highly divergent homeobox [Spea bombifrons]XP_053329809.1 highly divergent homeobox [Spea bombifrons]
MEGTVAPNVGEVTSTGSQGYQPEMNLRSVFTAEQQRILQRYYDSGMTNQSKSCFQLILQCAQETKLDFSVVRTWVGNKRRKMSSKNYIDTGAPLQGPVSNSPSRPPDVTVRNVPNITRSQPPRNSSGSDLIMTCVYSPNNSSVRQGTTPQSAAPKPDVLKPTLPRSTTRNDAEYLKLQGPVQRQAVPVSKSSLQQLDDKTIMLSRQQSVAKPPNSLYLKKTFGGPSGQMLERAAPQKTTSWSLKGVVEPPGSQRIHKPEEPVGSPVSHVSVAQRSRDSTCGLKNLEIREVFSLASTDGSSRSLGVRADERPRMVESNCFSIAMETGDAHDEYAREEELASMAAQHQACSRFIEVNSSPRLENRCTISPVPVRTGNCKTHPTNTRDLSENVYPNRDYYMSLNTSAHNTASTQYTSANATRNNLPPLYTAPSQLRLPPNQNNYQVSGNLTVPWITECSRKRTLQDRTQFSDHDLATLKKYWDNGMTSLGSVCREKIEAVASELNVDCEIVRTWIGNRRRKYRLMGIEVPPPRGGPATFPEQLESGSSVLSSGEDPVAEVSEDNDRNDDVSICLSEESSQADEMAEVGRNEDIVIKEDRHDALLVHNVKVEVLEEEAGDTASKFDVEQMRSLLEYKNEEIRYMESELENLKLKYAELQAFTRNLIHAVRTNDRDQQQCFLADPPVDVEDMDYNHASPEPDDTSYSMSSQSEKTTPDSV